MNLAFEPKFVWLIAFLMVTPRMALAYGDGAPPGHTGAFGEQNCTACHQDAGISRNAGAISLEGLPTNLAPGATYSLTLRFARQSQSRTGMQITVRSADGKVFGQLGSADGRTRLDHERGEALVHSEPGSWPQSDDEAVWQFNWTAPVTEVHETLFSIAVNASNNDDSAFGDHIYLKTFHWRSADQDE